MVEQCRVASRTLQQDDEPSRCMIDPWHRLGADPTGRGYRRRLDEGNGPPTEMQRQDRDPLRFAKRKRSQMVSDTA